MPADLRLCPRPVAFQQRSATRVGRFHGAETPIAAAAVGRAQRAAAGVRHRAQAGDAAATMTHTVPRRLHSTQTLWVGILGLRPMQERASTSSSCSLLIGQPLQLEIHGHVVGDRRGLVQRFDIRGRGVHDGHEVPYILEIAQRLDAAGRGARADA